MSALTVSAHVLDEPGTFDRAGLATLADLETAEWRGRFQELSTRQDAFLAARPHGEDYPWPRRPLQTWSRVWEYPYVAHHIDRWRAARSSHLAPVLDFGSGVTFFPFALAQRGLDVVCVDHDPICQRDVLRHAAKFEGAGKVTFALSRDLQMPIESASIGLLYSISVLEHLEQPHLVLPELARVLQPGGLLILTMDLGMYPGQATGIDLDQYAQLHATLTEHFVPMYAVSPTHPAGLLTTDCGPYPMSPRRNTLRGVWAHAKNHVLKPLLGRFPHVLACQGSVHRKRA